LLQVICERHSEGLVGLLAESTVCLASPRVVARVNRVIKKEGAEERVEEREEERVEEKEREEPCIVLRENDPTKRETEFDSDGATAVAVPPINVPPATPTMYCMGVEAYTAEASPLTTSTESARRGGGGPKTPSDACDLSVAVLSHIGRIEPDMSFLAQMAESAASERTNKRSRRVQTQLYTGTVAQSLSQNYSENFSQQQWQQGGAGAAAAAGEAAAGGGAHSVRHLLHPHMLTDENADHNRQALVGKWKIDSKREFDKYDRYLTTIGYPWYTIHSLYSHCMTGISRP
jgi:hypothetical protein